MSSFRFLLRYVLPLLLVVTAFTEATSLGLSLLNQPSDLAVFTGLVVIAAGLTLTFASTRFILRTKGK